MNILNFTLERISNVPRGTFLTPRIISPGFFILGANPVLIFCDYWTGFRERFPTNLPMWLSDRMLSIYWRFLMIILMLVQLVGGLPAFLLVLR